MRQRRKWMTAGSSQHSHVPLRRAGTGHPWCANEDGAAVLAARRRAEFRCPALAGDSGRAKLVVLPCAVGGRWFEDSHEFHRQVAQASGRHEPKALLSRVRQAWLVRRGTSLACSGARACALSLLERRGGLGEDGPTPLLRDEAWEARYGASTR